MEMRRRFAGLFLWTTVVVAAAAPRVWADDPLQQARDLYAAAAYDEALAKLEPLAAADLDQVDEYRALCLIALHRDVEATRTVEHLLRRHPLAADDLNDRSPKFVELYQAVRRQLLPELVTDAYRAAKARFEAKDYATAARQFHATLDLLGGTEPAAGLRDLQMVASEFLALAEQRAEATPAVAPREPAALMAKALPALTLVDPHAADLQAIPAPFTPVPRVYDSDDADVVPPVAIEQAMPPWNPPWDYAAHNTYTGRLEIIVGEDGSVRSADILRPSFGVYDSLLLHAVKKWRYQPAEKRNHPVQYRRTIDYVLKSPEQAPSAR